VQFTKLRLNGFKSFVDPTEVVIAHGLTGVVGPNGCGKSNLLEALRWVMGENRPSAMRGDGMEDVIFAGTSTRPARNFAEVAITIDNSDRRAPQGFNEADQLEVIRRITRDAGSAYKANTRDVRARDVQMLFADASTGAHSPSLVRQGQISELINARPKARRRILEEAAGISGLYQRRHEAELKLKGAETNLTRVDDVIEQLASQLAQLARQARQAARYREISEVLRALEGQLLYRRWKEADAAYAAAAEVLKAAVTEAAEAEGAATRAGRARQEAEDGLPPLREEDAIAGAVVQKIRIEQSRLSDEAERATKTIATLEARLEQLGADRAREAQLDQDANETIGRLSTEARDLEEAGQGHDDALEAASVEAREAAAVLQTAESRLAELTEDAARLAARHQSAQRMLEDAANAKTRAEEGAKKAKASLEEAKEQSSRSADVMTNLRHAHDRAVKTAERAEEALAAADAARNEAQAREASARAARSEATGELHALKAEVAALSKLVAREAQDKTQLLDVLKVQSGFEQALGAALADDLRAPIVTGGSGSGWTELPAYSKPQALPGGAKPLSSLVTGPGVLARRLSQVGVVDQAAGADLQKDLLPGQRLVSAEGDLWRWDGFVATSDDLPSTAALRLQQLNRIEELKKDVSLAEGRAGGAEKAHEALKAQLADLTRLDAEARENRRAADKALTDANRELSRAEADSNIAAGRLETLTHALGRHEEEAEIAAERTREAERGLEDLDDLDTLRQGVEDAKMAVEASRVAMMSRRSIHDELRREGEARSRRLEEVQTQIESWQARLTNAETRMGELTDRVQSTEEELTVARAAPGEIETQIEKLLGEAETAETRRKAAADALALAETAQREAVEAERAAERRASELREARAAAEARAEAAKEVVETAVARIREEQDTSPEELLNKIDVDPDQMKSAEQTEVEISRLKRQRDALGAVNLRAEEDAREVQEEHDTLLNEKTDLEEAIQTLRSGIASLNREGRERLLTAFEQVNANFETLFKHLFGGGEAKLVMVESDDPLEAGLEIMCQPPGKRLSALSLLSGGEQTLTALALIFAVFLANPSPICVLDEVDAPLDDANVSRFCDLLDEMSRRTETRFMIITHHAVTMARMDRLFGVTMGEQGVSQLVSVDLTRAEQLVA